VTYTGDRQGVRAEVDVVAPSGLYASPMIDEEAAKAWFRNEIKAQGARARTTTLETQKLFARGCVDGYVRAAVHLELGDWDEWRAIAKNALGN
jgi:hypothetical protein